MSFIYFISSLQEDISCLALFNKTYTFQEIYSLFSYDCFHFEVHGFLMHTSSRSTSVSLFTLLNQSECLSKVANFLHPTDIFSTCAWMMRKPFSALLIFHRRFLTFQSSRAERDACKSPWLVEFNLSLSEIATCIIHFLHLTLYTLSSSFPPNILLTSSCLACPLWLWGHPDVSQQRRTVPSLD